MTDETAAVIRALASYSYHRNGQGYWCEWCSGWAEPWDGLQRIPDADPFEHDPGCVVLTARRLAASL